MIETRFKDTEIGKIPVEWEEGELLEACSLAANNIHSFQIKAIDYIGTENMLSNGMGVLPFEGTLSDNIREYKECDVLISNIRPYLKKIWYAPHNGGCSADVLVFRSNNEDKLNSKYLYYTLSAERFFSYLTGNSIGTKMPRGDKKSLANFIIPIPPLPEQRRIADALSKVDSLIESLDKLIAKKKAIKRGAMQELLSGKKRLPGFNGEWNETKIGDVADLYIGYAFNSDDYTSWGKFKVITISNVQNGDFTVTDCNRISLDNIKIRPYQYLKKGDILISMTGNVGRVCVVTQNDCVLNQRVGKIVPRNINRDFLFNKLNTQKFYNDMTACGKGAAQLNLSNSDIMDYIIHYPIDLSEQRAIAHVLSTMDAEIDALKQKREKYQQVKQGMMQDLLTGRIRLVDNEAD